jgi:predicted HTH transcriptional regulator
LPPDAIGEAIINAIAHRDYHSNASVEVRLLADRIEVWNPGRLPGTLTFDDLRNDHPSVPNNPLIAESLYLTRYIEKAGSGTQRMIELCREAGLPEPKFEQRSGSFVITLWRDWLTAEVLAKLGLNERQMEAITYLKTNGVITNADLQKLVGCPQRTATRDLNELSQKGVIELEGKGRGARYRLLRKRAINAPNAPSENI